MNPTEPQQTTSPPIDTPSKGDAQPVDVETDLVHCVECLWWASDQGADKGKCHRHAPRPGNFGWATTKRTDFCGDAKPKPDTTPLPPINIY